MKKPEIFCDADGVLLDFNMAAQTALREAGLATVGYDEPTDWNWFEKYGISEDRFWEIIHSHEERFYSVLVSPYVWAQDLMAFLQSIGNVRILTKMSRHPSTYYGKAIILDRYFPDVPVITMSHNEKNLLASPGRILLDDNNENVYSWSAAGGTGIFLPQPWNDVAKFTNSRFRYLLRKLRQAGVVSQDDEIRNNSETSLAVSGNA